VKPAIAITVGDFNGIGPEVALRAIRHPSVIRACTPVLVGPLRIFEAAAKHNKLPLRFEKSNLSRFRSSPVSVVDVGDGLWSDVTFGTPTKSSGRSAGVAIERAADLCVQRKVSAMVTAPVSKEALALAGYNFPGQTEMVALLSRSQRVAMMLIGPDMRIGLATVHTPLRDVATSLSAEKITEKADILHAALKRDFGIRTPRIAVLALNPHAGEHGILGGEESDLIAPALSALAAKGVKAEGPFPADAFFGTHAYRGYDAVLAMYHDQGLIPLKLKGFAAGVNFSAGLPIVRTSPDHGTAYDIAGKRKADPASMIAAIQLALRIVRQRQRYDRTA
jgi:4-hydroxythreonine-4-phosphate dehydrogenase